MAAGIRRLLVLRGAERAGTHQVIGAEALSKPKR